VEKESTPSVRASRGAYSRLRRRHGALALCIAASALAAPTLALALIGSGSGLVVAVRPPGSGAVVGPGFTCEDECSYKGELPVTLTALAKPGHTFKSWVGCEAGGVNGSRCTVSSGARPIAATFVATPTLTVSKAGGLGTVNSSPAGISCSTFCTSTTAKFLGGTKVTLKPVPAKHSHFVQWLGDCGPVFCELSMDEDHEVEAVFAEDPRYPLTMVKTGDGQGLVKSKPAGIACAYLCEAVTVQFYSGQVVELQATPRTGDTLQGWYDCDSKPEGRCIVLMTDARKVTPEFGPNARLDEVEVIP